MVEHIPMAPGESWEDGKRDDERAASDPLTAYVVYRANGKIARTPDGNPAVFDKQKPAEISRDAYEKCAGHAGPYRVVALVEAEAVRALADALALVLPLAKGYAVSHSNVESSQRYIGIAQDALAALPPALREEAS